MIRTVLGDIDSGELGLCYSHEHILIDESFPTLLNEKLLLNDVEKITEELKHLYRLGVRSMVDTMPVNAGRNILKLSQISRETGMQIIAPTGIHLEMYYLPDHWRYHYSEDQLTQLFIDDIEVGIDIYDYGGPLVKRSEYKAGLIKLATGDEPITEHQKKIFRSVVNAHLSTGAPILTHTNSSKHALEQVNLFEKMGADLSHTVLSHVDKHKSINYHRELLQSGVYLEYDSAFRWKEGEKNWTYELLEKLLSEFPNQIVMGMDAAKNEYWKSYGGSPGLDFLITTCKDELIKRGLGEYFEKIFSSNPAQLFSFSEPVAGGSNQADTT